MPIPPPPPPPTVEIRRAEQSQGDAVRIGGITTEGTWIWIGGDRRSPRQLWIPLDILTGRLGFQRVQERAGEALEWFGERRLLASLPTRTLDDEVAVDAAPWFRALKVGSSRSGKVLSLTLSSPRVLALRQGKGSTAGRLVLDLSGPALMQRRDDDLLLGVRTTPAQNAQLKQIGLTAQRQSQALVLKGKGEQPTLTLAGPWRIVIDGLNPTRSPGRVAQGNGLQAALMSPAIKAAQAQGLVLDVRTVRVGVKPLLVYRAGTPFDSDSLSLRPLPARGSQTGLRYLTQLAQQERALTAVNGGFFNRVRQLPLGAIRMDGTWISGPILNRGAIGWSIGQPLLFDRLRLDQTLQVAGGRRWGLGHLNSGYVQRGLSRYTRAWGPVYKALSGEEKAISIRAGKVIGQHDRAALVRGVPLAAGSSLIVSRAGAPLPAKPGDQVSINLRPSSPVGQQPQVLAGGPLLLKGGRMVLQGRQEGFSQAFLSQSAPRTVVGQDDKRVWLFTLRGRSGSDPTLLETTLALQQLGISDALNLDGGSSTTLVAANHTLMTGRGVTPRVQNGLGFVSP